MFPYNPSDNIATPASGLLQIHNSAALFFNVVEVVGISTKQRHFLLLSVLLLTLFWRDFSFF